MWWGIWVQSLVLPIDWTISGAIANTLLFLCISIPLMESRQLKNKPDYAQNPRETRMLIRGLAAPKQPNKKISSHKPIFAQIFVTLQLQNNKNNKHNEITLNKGYHRKRAGTDCP